MMLAAPTPEQILATFKGMTAEMRAAVDSFLMLASPAIWVPQAGPQSAAFHSQADILFYGGSAGGGKSELLLGLSLTEQEHSIVFRREAVQLIGLEERMTAILGSRLGYNGQDHLWRLPDKKVLELGSVQKPDDWMKYQGRPHDFKGFDEITHFTELQFRTLIGWMRTDTASPNSRRPRRAPSACSNWLPTWLEMGCVVTTSARATKRRWTRTARSSNSTSSATA